MRNYTPSELYHLQQNVGYATTPYHQSLPRYGVVVRAGIPQPAPQDMTEEEFSAWSSKLSPDMTAKWEEANWTIRGMVELGYIQPKASEG